MLTKRSALVFAMALSACTLDSEPLGPGPMGDAGPPGEQGLPGEAGPPGTSQWADDAGQVGTDGDVAVGGNLTVNGNLTVGGNLAIADTLTVKGRTIGSCPDDMAQVGDFCVDKYEAIVVDETFYNGGACNGSCEEDDTCFGTNGGDNYPPTFPDNGNWTVRLYACSVPDEIPSRSMTWFQAAQACANSGKHLITNAEWQAAAAGTPDGSASCNISTSSPTAAENWPDCYSKHGAFNMVGNLWEWTADWFVAGRDWQTDDGQNAIPWPDDSYGGDTTRNVDGRAYGADWVEGLPAVALRGGNWGYGGGAGVFTAHLDSGPTSSGLGIGFRCARSL